MSQTTTANGNEPHDAGSAADETPVVVDKGAAYRTPGEAAELLRSDAGDIKAERVDMDRSGAETITAERVSMDRSGARRLDAKSAHLENSGAVLLKAEKAVFYGGAAVAVSTEKARIVQSNVVALKTSDKTTIEGAVNTLLYLGPVDEKIKPFLTGAGAASFGAGFALTLLGAGRLLRWLARRG